VRQRRRARVADDLLQPRVGQRVVSDGQRIHVGQILDSGATVWAT